MNDHIETEAVKRVIQNYIDGTYEADTEKLKGVFHKNAVMNGYLGPELILGDPSGFIEDIGSAPSMRSGGDPFRAEIESIYIQGNVASVTLSESGFRGEAFLVDFFHLIKEEGEWSIIAKLFTTV